MAILFTNIKQLLTFAGDNAPRAGAAMRETRLVKNAAVLTDGGMIVAAGPRAAVSRHRLARKAKKIEAGGVCLPGFVDSHTHAVFAEPRLKDFSMRTAGASYQDIKASGGGIISSIGAVRRQPQRAMAAYLKAATLLAHLDYLGDLKCKEPLLRRARVFGDGKQYIAVLYTQSADVLTAVKLNVPVKAILGIDGRALALNGAGAVPIPHGMTYVILDPAAVAAAPNRYLEPKTPAMRLWNSSRKTLAKREISPLVIQPMLKTFYRMLLSRFLTKFINSSFRVLLRDG